MKYKYLFFILLFAFMLFTLANVYGQDDLGSNGMEAPPHAPPPTPNSPSFESTVDNGDGTFTFTQQVDEASTSPHYVAPGGYGFEIYSWFDEDYGWMHDFSQWNTPYLNILSATLTIHAWDVDSEPFHGYYGEYDGVHIDGTLLSPGYLQGTNGTWSTTVFDVPITNITDDGDINVWLDIDMHHDYPNWATTLDYSKLEITYSTFPNDPPYQPVVTLLPSDVCVSDDDDLVAQVTGPDPADPDGDAVTYEFRWFVDIGTGGFIDDEFAGRGDHTGNTVPAADTEVDDIWQVQVIPKDEHNAIGPLATVTYPQVVTSCNEPPSIAADNANVSVNEGLTASNTGTVSDPDGDPVTLSASIGTVVNNGDGTWSWSFDTHDGPAESQVVTIYADDGNGGTDQTSFNLTVNNVAPTVLTLSIPIDPVSIYDQPVSVSATFSDPAGTYDEDYTGKIDCHDGTGEHDGIVSGTNCSGDHTFTEPGVYKVTVTVTDKDGDSGSKTTIQYIVIYDPADGFVTGGGWINSPAGAFTANTSLTGKANFGFVSKYKKGKTVPSGNTEFQFHAANMNFHSSDYDWLVIAGSKAMFKGTGTINGGGSYKFMVSAIDGDLNGDGLDKFRIKIMGNGGVVYDNQIGEDDDADPTTIISGGSIVIHKKGKFAKSLFEVEPEEESNDVLPQKYSLSQNHPNPFNPVTSIRFALPQEEFVQIKVFNAVGQKVATLVNSHLNAGDHIITWNASDLSTGIYFYSIKAGQFHDLKKMILTK